MAIAKGGGAPWLLLTFTLPTKSASKRVEVWRKLQRYGAVPLGNSGYLLPNDPATLERFEWLATAIRKYAGEASVVKIQSIDNLSTPQLVGRFAKARARDYQELIRELRKISSARGRKNTPGHLRRLRARFLEIAQVDFFNSPLQKRVEELLARADTSPAPTEETVKADPREYVGRAWVTRPRPGIDRSASAWLIQRFIDKKARF
ncbi:MAG TPA: Chromate resistance protein ChrB, partial [Terriglobia bacterium]|nr:Chromate resistance protein ChrB [Terriglobia bacterium]